MVRSLRCQQATNVGVTCFAAEQAPCVLLTGTVPQLRRLLCKVLNEASCSVWVSKYHTSASACRIPQQSDQSRDLSPLSITAEQPLLDHLPSKARPVERAGSLKPASMVSLVAAQERRQLIVKDLRQKQCVAVDLYLGMRPVCCSSQLDGSRTGRSTQQRPQLAGTSKGKAVVGEVREQGLSCAVAALTSARHPASPSWLFCSKMLCSCPLPPLTTSASIVPTCNVVGTQPP